MPYLKDMLTKWLNNLTPHDAPHNTISLLGCNKRESASKTEMRTISDVYTIKSQVISNDYTKDCSQGQPSQLISSELNIKNPFGLSGPGLGTGAGALRYSGAKLRFLGYQKK